MKKLTEKQKTILNFIRDFSMLNKMAPTVYEIADHFNIKTSTVFAHLKALQKKNYLQRSSKARSISLKKTFTKKTLTSVHSIPFQENNLKEQIGKRIFYDAAMLPNSEKLSDPDSCFAIVMDENCYLSRGILPGDIAILLKNPVNITPGDLIMAMINDHKELLECKKIYDEQIEFFNFHQNGSIIFPADQVPLEGKVIGIQRAL